MKKGRNWIPLLGLIALAALFFKLPEISNLFGCKACSATLPYFSLIGSGYFALLIGASLLFPTFPGPQIARAGVTWAVLLAIVLTYLSYPNWCIACLVAHACHIAIWILWLLAAQVRSEKPASRFRERLCILLFAPLAVIALFSSLNLTFMAYGFKNKQAIASLQVGDKIPALPLDTSQAESVVINFFSPDCPYCKEQLPIINQMAAEHPETRFIYISPGLPPDQNKPTAPVDWIEDKDGSLHQYFKVSRYPTLFVVGKEGKIREVISGLPQNLRRDLLIVLNSGQL